MLGTLLSGTAGILSFVAWQRSPKEKRTGVSQGAKVLMAIIGVVALVGLIGLISR
jgi:hypothetical protein